jgi:hypothetical protein
MPKREACREGRLISVANNFKCHLNFLYPLIAISNILNCVKFPEHKADVSAVRFQKAFMQPQTHSTVQSFTSTKIIFLQQRSAFD